MIAPILNGFIAWLVGIVFRSIRGRGGKVMSARKRTYLKGGKVIIHEPKHDHRIVGDVTHPEGEVGRTLPRRPRTARISDMLEQTGY